MHACCSTCGYSMCFVTVRIFLLLLKARSREKSLNFLNFELNNGAISMTFDNQMNSMDDDCNDDD